MTALFSPCELWRVAAVSPSFLRSHGLRWCAMLLWSGVSASTVWAAGPQPIDHLPIGRPPLPPAIRQAIEQGGENVGVKEVSRAVQETADSAAAPAPLPVQPAAASSAMPPSPPATPKAAAPTQTLNELYGKGEYGAVGTQGLALLQADQAQVNDDLRLKIANSLAWSDRLAQAVSQYEVLVRDASAPASAQAARTPLANAYRWQGRPDLAVPLYEEALQREANHADAQEGLAYAQRELRPRTTLKIGTSSDSGDLSIRSASIAHRWRDASRTQIYEVETDWRSYDQAPNGPHPHHAGVGLRYEHTALPFQPRLSLSTQGRPQRGAFGAVKVKLGDWPVHAEIAREPMGVTGSSARALSADITANRFGLETQFGGAWGSFSGRLNRYTLSDRNTLTTSTLQYNPNWRPFGPALKPYVGVETRQAKFNTPNYWSPADGFGSLGVGITAEWVQQDWFFYTIAQVGTRLYGEAGSSWSASIGGQRWLSKDIAVTGNLWAMSSIRDQSRYKAHSLTLKLDKLW